MSVNFYDKFLYKQSDQTHDGFDASNYNLNIERKIRQRWKLQKKIQLFFRIITLGFAFCSQKKLTSKSELKKRIRHFRDRSIEMENAAKAIQRFYARRLYQEQREIASEAKGLQAPQIRSHLHTARDLISTWWKKGNIDILNGAKGQIIWSRAEELSENLKDLGYYVFFHAHSYPITLHLELSSHFQSLHQSEIFKQLKPLESRRKFRAPGVARHFANTSDYLKSDLAKAINNGWTMDDNHRETIISCDAIPDNDEAYESAQHFFKSNKSIVDTSSSTGLSNQKFDSSFIKSYLDNRYFQQFAVDLFSSARRSLKHLPGYGMIRVIAIANETLENEKTNYIWRSHAFGKLCKCKHNRRKYGHKEFVATLRTNQEGKCNPCPLTGHKSLPQYRILAGNLDRDITKQIYTMDCLNEDEREVYTSTFDRLQRKISKMIKLEQMGDCKTYEELLATLKGIDARERNERYCRGVSEVLHDNELIIRDHLRLLRKDLPRRIFNLIVQEILEN